MLTDSLVEAFRVRLEALGFDLADLRIGGTPNRPLVQVRIDWPPDSPGSGAGGGGGGGAPGGGGARGGGGQGAGGEGGGPPAPPPVLGDRAPGVGPPRRGPRPGAGCGGRTGP